ncbi:MAG TPA: ABC transporter ATP-binding protein, partial [Frankiaceae bacterium]|nr:ABC transporter ATP-binding protein [Frankiaceae bacterium]
MSEDAPVVQCAGLTKYYGRHPALVDLDLTVRRGEVFGYLGPNGAGKTTTLRVVMGFLRPTRGRVEVLGLDAWREATRVHRRVGYLPGEPVLYDRLTGRELLTFLGHLRGGADLSYAHKLAERFDLDLDLDRPIRALSKGNRQKVVLTQAFMS